MASIDLQKKTLNGLKGMKVHFDDKLREEREHSNKDIQKELTKNDYWLGCHSFKDVCNRVEARTAEVDLLHPPKKITKDRVTVISGIVYCPKAITDAGRVDEFMQKAYTLLIERYGTENVHGMQVHKDEVHKYIDYQGGEAEEKESLIHGHFWLSPYAKWTEKGVEREGINGKNFLKKSTYNDLNRCVDRMCRKEFGVAYLTGGVAGKKSVEQLKKENETLRVAKERAEQAVVKAEQLEDDLKEKKEELDYVKSLPGGMVVTKKARLEQLEETEKKYEEEKPLIKEAKRNLRAASDAMKEVVQKQEQLDLEKKNFNEVVNKEVNRRITLLKDKALSFIRDKGLWHEFVSWTEKIVEKVKEKVIIK